MYGVINHSVKQVMMACARLSCHFASAFLACGASADPFKIGAPPPLILAEESILQVRQKMSSVADLPASYYPARAGEVWVASLGGHHR